jgi:hypothetical protein
MTSRLGCNALRLTLEWSRIEPREGFIDQAAVGRCAARLADPRPRARAAPVQHACAAHLYSAHATLTVLFGVAGPCKAR